MERLAVEWAYALLALNRVGRASLGWPARASLLPQVTLVQARKVA